MYKFTVVLAGMALAIVLSACSANTSLMYNGKFQYHMDEENAT